MGLSLRKWQAERVARCMWSAFFLEHVSTMVSNPKRPVTGFYVQTSRCLEEGNTSSLESKKRQSEHQKTRVPEIGRSSHPAMSETQDASQQFSLRVILALWPTLPTMSSLQPAQRFQHRLHEQCSPSSSYACKQGKTQKSKKQCVGIFKIRDGYAPVGWSKEQIVDTSSRSDLLVARCGSGPTTSVTLVPNPASTLRWTGDFWLQVLMPTACNLRGRARSRFPSLWCWVGSKEIVFAYGNFPSISV